ncbi:hypothetical protein J7E99_34300 [Streptomyces sp. ISL-44]|uniref:hypothetical protein n=1 Tax=Streptomyces sp. ISL-44 TaxID=2819184 RepID=UPI001BE9284A|nr:hypothetical protein [Streptomyces sp. ISL-44]MBT2545624.1 hypothetical protein [Streptomyces sp. ISL-44]
MEPATADVTPFEELSALDRRLRNMDVLAAPLGWPEGMADRLKQIDRRFPEWMAWYYRDGAKDIPPGSCGARLVESAIGSTRQLVAPDPEELARLVEAEEVARQDRLSHCRACGQKLPEEGAERVLDPRRPQG